MNTPEAQQLQNIIANGITTGLSKLIYRAGIWFVIGLAVSVAVMAATGRLDRDSTDGERRSGMVLHRDARTGCHYLSTPSGGITPRLNRDGSHICGADQ